MEPQVINDQLDKIFSGNPAFSSRTFRVVKKPIQLKYETASQDGVCHTKEGEVAYKAGDAIMTGTAGEQWPIAAETFTKTYDVTSDGLASKKPIIISADRLDADADVQASWGILHGKAGDYVVCYGPGDYGVVDSDIFAETYLHVHNAAAQNSDNLFGEGNRNTRAIKKDSEYTPAQPSNSESVIPSSHSSSSSEVPSLRFAQDIPSASTILGKPFEHKPFSKAPDTPQSSTGLKLG